MIIKNVGVNACADPLLQATVQGLKGGVLLVVGDDPEAKGSQTAQDSRYYGELAQLPVIEPDETTCVTGVEAALGASEKFSRVAMPGSPRDCWTLRSPGALSVGMRAREGLPIGPGPCMAG